MLEIKVRLIGLYRKIANSPEIVVEIEEETLGKPTTIYDLLKKISSYYGEEMESLLYTETGEVDDWSRIMINGKDIRFIEESEKILKPGDFVHIFSMAAGG
ncbi:MoaD/ThiS family protein [Miniphocaeibacter halophilus]|uniref:MoaD/ThiS family protein n=1 Tax=Miniphocaeibacter halophilus TaxID=2931922 RepID=A0AC61MRQ3_9FIRM|nr:MoaD/ThiS family protein [Miniphocaeibacter halophilus]QQK06866.1 MoaD/ThiS family protein [Miniphocaeibacter halophilus]